MKRQTIKDLFKVTKHLMIRHGEVSSCQTKIFSYGSLLGGYDPIMTCRKKTMLNANNNMQLTI